MGASSERRGRKIRREGGHRTPACKACESLVLCREIIPRLHTFPQHLRHRTRSSLGPPRASGQECTDDLSCSKTGQQRKVKCSGGSPCSACCRKAAWDGVPPPDHCEYDGGAVPARKPGKPALYLVTFRVCIIELTESILVRGSDQLLRRLLDSQQNRQTLSTRWMTARARARLRSHCRKAWHVSRVSNLPLFPILRNSWNFRLTRAS